MTLKPLTRHQMDVIDKLSMRVDEVLDEKVRPILEGMKKAEAGFNQLPGIKAEQKKEGITPAMAKEAILHEEDSPYYEGHSGLRSFFGQGLKPQIVEQWRLYHLTETALALQKTWFANGGGIFSKLPKDQQRTVMQLAARFVPFMERMPLHIYREEDKLLALKPGDKFRLSGPKSWSAAEKVVMGQTTLVVTTMRGTHVSVLSQFLGEEEVLSYEPKGYVVTKVEDHKFAGRLGRRVVHLFGVA